MIYKDGLYLKPKIGIVFFFLINTLLLCFIFPVRPAELDLATHFPVILDSEILRQVQNDDSWQKYNP
jgi:hypothetical protein